MEHQSAIYDLIQDRIVELLEEKDPGGRLEEEEQEAVEQGQLHREHLEALLNSVEVHVKTHDLKDQLQELEEAESLKGTAIKEQLDEVTKELKDLHILGAETIRPEEFRETICELRHIIRQLRTQFEEDKPDALDISTTSLSSRPNHRPSLPQLKLPVFEGDPMDWITFWELFQTMIGRESYLTDAEKLYYLRASIQSKEGQRMVAAVTTRGGSYDNAVADLQALYDRRRVAFKSHLQLIKLTTIRS